MLSVKHLTSPITIRTLFEVIFRLFRLVGILVVYDGSWTGSGPKADRKLRLLIKNASADCKSLFIHGYSFQPEFVREGRCKGASKVHFEARLLFPTSAPTSLLQLLFERAYFLLNRLIHHLQN